MYTFFTKELLRCVVIGKQKHQIAILSFQVLAPVAHYTLHNQSQDLTVKMVENHTITSLEFMRDHTVQYFYHVSDHIVTCNWD